MATVIAGLKSGNSIIPYSQTTKRTKEVDNSVLIISASQGSIASTTAKAIAYCDSNDKWWLQFSFQTTYTNGASSNGHEFSLTGVLFEGASTAIRHALVLQINNIQAVDYGGICANTRGASNDIDVVFTTGQTFSAVPISVSGVVPLASEPDWAAANMEAASNASIYIEPASATKSGLVTTGAQEIAGPKTFSSAMTPSGGIVGKTDGVAVGAGKIAEVIQESRDYDSRTGIANNGTVANVTASPLTLTAGLWRISGVVGIDCGTTTTMTYLIGSISKVSATHAPNSALGVPTADGCRIEWYEPRQSTATGHLMLNIPDVIANISSTTDFYLTMSTIYSAASLSENVWGSITAQRI